MNKRSQKGSQGPQLGTSLRRGEGSQKKDNRLQTLYKEISVDPDILTQILEAGESRQEDNQIVQEIKHELAEYIVSQCPTVLTGVQWSVLQLWLQGRYSQQQIADLLGVSQTTICKTLNGNDAYNPDGTVTRYGGIIAKLQGWASTDPYCLQLLQEMQDVETGEF
jgi:predicted DNA-binding protein YlxM (UPF0122 family)